MSKRGKYDRTLEHRLKMSTARRKKEKRSAEEELAAKVKGASRTE